MSPAARVRFRRANVGFIFQSFNLLPALTAVENAAVPLIIAGWSRARALPAAAALLDRLGLGSRLTNLPSELSGGQQQRAAIARTLVQGAKLVLADEPIASLDPESSRKVMEILSTIQREDGRTVIVSLHQVDMAIRYCPRVIALNQGQVIYDGPAAALTPALLRDLYGMQADEFLSGSELLPSAQAQTPAPTLAWSKHLAQAA